MKGLALAVAALIVAASGCMDSGAKSNPDAVVPQAPLSMTIKGLVQDSGFVPVAHANVSLRLTKLTTTTDAAGKFEFTGLTRSAYLVDVRAPGFENATLTAEPKEVASLSFVMLLPPDLRPHNVTVIYRGFLECALEAVIISPSCDSLSKDPRVGGPAVFNDTSVFTQTIDQRWKTVVVDVDFDAAANRGLDGMRVTTRGKNDADSFGTYDQYGRFHGSQPFTFRIEPGETYPEGQQVPVNATIFRFEGYPHGHYYHPGGAGVLGVGFAQNVKFTLYVTIFYNEPAPENWSFRTSGAP